MSELIERVQKVADSLFAEALDVDRSGVIPEAHWQMLSDEGMFALAAPLELGGPGLTSPEILEVLERMAGGCLATTFTWMQHHAIVMSLAASPNTALRAELLPDAMAGRTRYGVASAGVIPDVPRMRAQRVDGGWRFHGRAPLVSGWGIVHALQIYARDVDSDDVLSGVVEAREQPGITGVDPLDLVAVDASRTVSLSVDGLVVPDERIVSRASRAEFEAGQPFLMRAGASTPLGVTLRCALLLDEAGQPEAATHVRARCDAVRAQLDATLDDLPALHRARADASTLAVHAASALVVADGGPSLLRSRHAQLMAREAMFTLVATSRPELKRQLLQNLTGRHAGPQQDSVQAGHSIRTPRRAAGKSPDAGYAD